MRISDWSSDVCSSDLQHRGADRRQQAHAALDAPADLSAVQQVDWMERVEGVDLHAGTAVDIPAEALLEDAVAQTIHLSKLVAVLPIAVGRDKQDHGCLL